MGNATTRKTGKGDVGKRNHAKGRAKAAFKNSVTRKTGKGEVKRVYTATFDVESLFCGLRLGGFLDYARNDSKGDVQNSVTRKTGKGDIGKRNRAKGQAQERAKNAITQKAGHWEIDCTKNKTHTKPRGQVCVEWVIRRNSTSALRYTAGGFAPLCKSSKRGYSLSLGRTAPTPPQTRATGTTTPSNRRRIRGSTSRR